MNSKEIIGGYVGQDPVQALYLGSELIWTNTPPGPVPYDQQYLTVEMLSAGTFTKNGNVNYSVNGGAWETGSTRTLNLNAGDKVRFKYTGTLRGGEFSGNTTPFIIYGNLLSISLGDNFQDVTSTTAYFTRTFKNSTGLVSAENLIFPAVNDSRYEYMFQGCTNLTTPPSLPATSVGVMYYIGMFMGCTSLTKAPVLPAQTLDMRCYENMFYGCTSLKYIKCLATDISATDCTKNWVSGITTDGVFVQASGATWGYGVNGIPETWIGLDAPQHEEGLWITYRETEDQTVYYEVSGSTSGDSYEFPVEGSGNLEYFALFQDGNYVFLDEVDICGYDCSGSVHRVQYHDRGYQIHILT